ncbi:unnamed protein product [Arabidopsis halleri]
MSDSRLRLCPVLFLALARSISFPAIEVSVLLQVLPDLSNFSEEPYLRHFILLMK